MALSAPRQATLWSDQYDALDRVRIRQFNESAGGTAIASSWDYGSGDDLNAIQHNYGGIPTAYAYGYDTSHRVSSFSVTRQSVDVTPRPSAGSSCGSTYNALNQMQQIPCTNATPSYDRNGNLLSDGVRTFTYDNEGDGRILTASNGSTSASYGYDPDGNRISKTVNGTTTTYAVDQSGREIAELVGGTIQHLYAYSASDTAPVAVIDASGNPVFNHTDRLGSVIATSSGGATMGTFGYTPYGAPTQTISGTSFGYAGYRYDPETALYHTATRSYDPNLGRFLQTDPISYAGGRNTYAYTAGNPINATDPGGTVENIEVRAPNRETGLSLIYPGLQSAGLGRALRDGGETDIVVRGHKPKPAPTPAPLEDIPQAPAPAPQPMPAPIPAPEPVPTLAPEPAPVAQPSPPTPQPYVQQVGLPIGGLARLLGGAVAGAEAVGKLMKSEGRTGAAGKSSAPLKNAPYQRTRNSSGEINGTPYTGHAFDQMQNRGIPPSAVQNTIDNGIPFQAGPNAKGFYDPTNNLRVILGGNGQVVTVIPGAP